VDINENCLHDLTRLSGPAAPILMFNDLNLSVYIAAVGPTLILNNLRHRLLASERIRKDTLAIISAPWFPAGGAKCHEMSLYELKVRLSKMSENRFEETLQILTWIKQWKGVRRAPEDVDSTEFRTVRNLASFYDLFYPGLKTSIG
jgi:hypothetical protein